MFKIKPARGVHGIGKITADALARPWDVGRMSFTAPKVRSVGKRRLTTTRVSHVRAAFVLLASGIVLAACSSSGSPASPSSSKPTSAIPASVMTTLDAALKDKSAAPPSSAPPHKAGVHLWLISPLEASPTGAALTDGAGAAARALGWTTTVCDGNLGFNYVSCVRQGIAQKVDAIIGFGMDCPPIKQALVDAKAAGIPFVDAGGFDCNDPAFGGGGAGYFTASVENAVGFPSQAEFWKAIGKARADAVIAESKGTAKIISAVFSDIAQFAYNRSAFVSEITANCPQCAIISVQSSAPDLGNGAIVAKISAALVQHPEATAVEVPVDSVFQQGLGQAIKASGRASKLYVIGTNGVGANVQLIKADGGESATIVTHLEWFGWAAVDTTIRVLAKQPLVTEGNGFVLVDSAHLPKSDDAPPPVDYVADYKRAWGVS